MHLIAVEELQTLIIGDTKLSVYIALVRNTLNLQEKGCLTNTSV